MMQKGQVMQARIGKDFHWEMGHRLPWHEGGCRNVHGHSYRMRVELFGEVDERGMVVDYFDLKAAVEPLVDELDHAFLCDENDKPMRDFFDANPMKFVLVPFPSTAENIAAYLLDRIVGALAKYDNLEEISVFLQETERTFASVSRKLK